MYNSRARDLTILHECYDVYSCGILGLCINEQLRTSLCKKLVASRMHCSHIMNTSPAQQRVIRALTLKLAVEGRKPRILRDHAYEADIVVARMLVQDPYAAGSVARMLVQDYTETDN